MKKHKLKIIFFIIFIFIIVLASGIYGYTRYQLSKVKTVSLKESDDELYVTKYKNESNTNSSKKEPDIKNIVFIGVDAKNPDGSQRSDSVMVVTADFEHKDIKLTSIMRDTYVEFPGMYNSRMGHSYQDGGPALVIKTINKNFQMDVTDYVKVDFGEFSKIIDSIGGVKIDIKDYELPTMQTVGIKKAGTYNLNGTQALAYSRIRHQGMGDYERTERQRTVITKIFEKIKDSGPTSFVSTVTKLLPFVETSLSTDDILSLGTKILTSGINNVKQFRIPIDNHVTETHIDGQYYITFDGQPTIDLFHKFIYDDIIGQ